jgi:hypothetical protein
MKSGNSTCKSGVSTVELDTLSIPEHPKAIVKEYIVQKNSGILSSENSSIHQSISSTRTTFKVEEALAVL